MSMTSESDERIVPNNCLDSPSTDDANSVGSNMGTNGSLKKGPWTSAEDAILIEYVTKHGEGNWNALQKHSGLARCGKSCRLRWANHLRPDLKKGAFTPEEERRIIELHAKMGNKWARMAAELPGRTDNEIKNFWNTRIKRRQRAGLPIYPHDICFQASDHNPQTEGMNALTPDNVPPHPDMMPVDNFMKIPPVEFKGLELNHRLYSHALIDINPTPTDFLEIPSSGLLPRNFDPPYRHHQSKRLRGSESFFQTPIGGPFYQTDYYLTPNVFELPSLQTRTGNGSSPSSPLTFFEPVDILIQTPPTEHARNSGLLEEVLYESVSLKNSNGNAFRQLSRASGTGNDDDVSSLGRSPPSIFSGSNPITPVSGNSFDEPLPDENFPGCEVKNVASNMDPMVYDDKIETTNHMIFSRPDYFLTSNCLGPMRSPNIDDGSVLENSTGKYIDGDLSRDCKQMNMGPSSSGLPRGPWNAMWTV